MGSGEGSGEKEAPSPAPAAEAPDEGRAAPAKVHATRDARVLSAAFLLVFSAANAAQNLESSVHTKHGLGSTSVGVIYLSFTLFSLLGSPVIRVLGSKRALVVGTTGYWLFIAANLKPSWYTMVPASAYLGFAATMIWVGQGTYLTSAARRHARDCDLDEGTVIGNFNGEFWGIFACTQVLGNLVPFILFKIGRKESSTTTTTLLFGVFLGMVTSGAVLMCFLSRRDAGGEHEETAPGTDLRRLSVLPLLRSAISPLLDRRMLLLVPLLSYSGLQQAFAWAELTKNVVKPALGVSGVGGAMAVYGAFDAICSLVAGRLTSGIASIAVIVSSGALLQLALLLWILLQHSAPTGGGGLLGTLLHPLLVAALWGVGDGAFNTQLSVLLGILFKNQTEAAFAQMKVWQSASTAAVFFLSPHITLHAMSIAMVSAIFVSMFCFLYLALRIEGAWTQVD